MIAFGILPIAMLTVLVCLQTFTKPSKSHCAHCITSRPYIVTLVHHSPSATCVYACSSSVTLPAAAHPQYSRLLLSASESLGKLIVSHYAAGCKEGYPGALGSSASEQHQCSLQDMARAVSQGHAAAMPRPHGRLHIIC